MKVEQNESKVKVLYIVGTGHSGSTLLNLILGSSKNAYSLGEVAHFSQSGLQQCNCSEIISTCDLWGEYFSKFSLGDTEGIYPLKSSFKEYLKFMFACLLKRNRVGLASLFSGKNYADSVLYNELLSKVKGSIRPGVEILIDSSKGFNRLFYLSTLPGIDLSVIHLVRDGRSVIHSYEKRGYSGFTRIFKWLLINLQIDFFCKKFMKSKSLRLSYDQFCMDPSLALAQINSFFGLKVDTVKYLDDVNSSVNHNFAGNHHVSRKKIESVRCDLSWKKNFSWLKATMLSVLLYVPNKIWVYPSKKKLKGVKE